MVMKRKHFATDKGMKYGFVLFVAVLLTPFLGWGQTRDDYSGIYYIRSFGQNANDNNKYYLCPTEGWCYFASYPQAPNYFTGTDNGKPFLTTYKCRTTNTYNTNKAVWTIEKAPNSNYYHIKQTLTGKYLLSNGQVTTATIDRIRVHLEEVDNPSTLGDEALFDIGPYPTNNSYLAIRAVGIDETGSHDGVDHSLHKWLTVNGGNKNYLTGQSGKTGGPSHDTIGNYKNTSGIVGIYTQTDVNVPFGLEPATIDPPTITNNHTSIGTITITTETGATIYYTTDGTTPTTTDYTGTGTSSVTFDLADGVTVIKAIAKSGSYYFPSFVSTYPIPVCERPVITVSNSIATITCNTSGASIFYTIDGTPAMPSSTPYADPFNAEGVDVISAIATSPGYLTSNVAFYYPPIEVSSSGEITNMTGNYILLEGFTSTASIGTANDPFQGQIDGNYVVLLDLDHPLVAYADGATIKNVMLKGVTISANGNVGAICNEATGASRIYNCGILPTDPNFTATSSVKSNDGYCGGLVGLLDGSSRVINCFSFANITGGTTVAGIVGYNNTSGATQSNYTGKTIVMNCMFYGEISGGTTKYPVYGGNVIANDGEEAINNYNYYRGEATFDDDYGSEADYNRSWPAEERNLRRFEYYRSIFNSNRRLCTWWVSGGYNVVPTDSDVATVGIAKWVLDRSIAPYPVLKPWGKYPSVINHDPEQVWDTIGNQWVQRTDAAPYQGKNLGTLSITINSGAHPSTLDGLSETSQTLPFVITDMDTLNHDFCYAKVQLPYYNEVFGDPSSTNHLTRYYGNYTNKVVTGWKITSVNDNDQGSSYTFDFDWESGCNFADRSDKYKDLFAKTGRVFAQGGYYYVPEGVTAITIEAYWGSALYMHGKEHSLDRVSVCSYAGPTKNYGYAFTPAGTLPSTWVYNNMPIYDDLDDVVKNRLSTSSSTVYDQAVVLVGNFQVQARNDISLDYTNGKKVTFMSADLDMDNEPDFCWQFQWRLNTDRRQILPVRFDFLPIPELGLAIRHDKYAYAIGIFVPRGHFEITETAFMHTTQFEYMKYQGTNHQQPLIFNGGQFEQIVAKGDLNTYPQVDHTRNIILGGNVWMKRFTPGSHTGNSHKCIARHCAVSVMGGEYPEFYLSGLYRKDITTSTAYDDNPHCYTNGGRFGLIAGAGNEAVKNSVFFEIDHSIIGEFYGGGINANNPVAGSVNVVINNSLVNKYCGGPRIGTCQTVTTKANGTIFNHYFGGGNGGTNLYRDEIYDNNVSDMPSVSSFSGSTYGWSTFKPISTQGATATYSDDYGYHAEFEFEVFNQSNGINNEAVVRTYRHWAQFGTTSTGDVSNTLVDCIVNNNFYGGGNLGNVNGYVTSTLTNCNIFGNAYGGGFSASIPSFPVHDKTKVTFPKRDAAGVCHNGSVGYRTDSENNIIKYTWCYENPETHLVLPSGVEIPSGVTTSKPAFQYNGKWYCYTTVTLENLGAISGNTSITVEGNTSILGHVFGAGDSSKVHGDTFVHIKDFAKINGNVYGGGNMGEVGGHTKVVVNGQINSNGQGTGSGDDPTNH